MNLNYPMLSCINRCQFDGLFFNTTRELVAHVEEAHCGEQALRVKDTEAMKNPDELVRIFPYSYTQSSPLSRFFPIFDENKAVTSYSVTKAPIRLQFSYYKRKPQAVNAQSTHHHSSNQKASSHIGVDDEYSNSSLDVTDENNEKYRDIPHISAAETVNEQRYYTCPYEGCRKQYKNVQGMRNHARQIHGSRLTDLLHLRDSQDSSVDSSSRSITQPTENRIKCSYCTKRYKTVAGYNNHLQQLHNIHAPSNSTPSLTPVSPSAVSNITVQHSQVESNILSSQANIEQARAQNQMNVAFGGSNYPSNSASSVGVSPGLRVTAHSTQLNSHSLASGPSFQQMYASSRGPSSSLRPNLQIRNIASSPNVSRSSAPLVAQVASGSLYAADNQEQISHIPSALHGRPSLQKIVPGGIGRIYQHQSPMTMQRLRMNQRGNETAISTQYSDEIVQDTISIPIDGVTPTRG